MESRRRSCIVVGGGAAGLSAGAALSTNGFDVTIVEAMDRLGGRICQHPGWEPWGPLDMGAEYIHGSKSTLFGLAKKEGWPLTECIYMFEDLTITGNDTTRDYIHHKGRLYKMKKSSECSDLQEALKIFDDLNGLPFAHPDIENSPRTPNSIGAEDISLAGYFGRNGVDKDVQDLVRGIVCQELAVSVQNCGIQELSRWANSWVSGTDNYRIIGGYALLIKYYLDQLKHAEVKTKWAVTQIDYDDAKRKVSVFNKNGDVLTADTAVVTLPLTVLRDGDVTFCPPLPEDKSSSARRINMETSLKVYCRFKKPFWPDFGIIICSNGLMGQIHQERRHDKCSLATEAATDRSDPMIKLENGDLEEKEDELSTGCYILSAFQTGDLARKADSITPEEITKTFLTQLDNIFGGLGIADSETPATDNFLESVAKLWSHERYIRGSYCSPTFGSSESDYCNLAAPVGRSLFFAGEATCIDMPACVEAAVTTGMRAATEVIKSYQDEE